ncbi:unnamed protein product [Gadus morhua 'NCC']
MPTSPVKTRIPLTSFGHLITEVKRQLFGIEAPAAVDLIGWKKYFNSYTLQGRRNSKNDEDAQSRWRQEGPVHLNCPTHFLPFRSPGEYQLVKQTYLLLQSSGFYWGSLSMGDAHHMLRETAPGTFLIRDSYQCNVFFTLSYQGEDHPKSIRLLLANHLFGMDGSSKTFDSLFALLVHYITSSKKIVAPYRWQRPETLQQLGRRAVIRAHGAHTIDSLPGLSAQVRAYLHAYPFWV